MRFISDDIAEVLIYKLTNLKTKCHFTSMLTEATYRANLIQFSRRTHVLLATV
jgi:hypothetical protein